METSQPLSIESFSYSWLVNLKPSLDSLENSFRVSLDAASDEAYYSSFIEMDPRMTPSKRFFRSSQDFKFDFPVSQSSLTLVHADELISNGYLMPLFVEPLKIEAFHHDEASSNSNSNQNLPISLHSPKHAVSGANDHSVSSNSMRRCLRLSRRIIQKYFNFFRPLYRRIIRGNQRTSSKAGHGDKRIHHHHHHHQAVKNSRVYSSETSPRISSVDYSADDWRKSCDSDSSIYEAVLHCKRSIGK